MSRLQGYDAGDDDVVGGRPPADLTAPEAAIRCASALLWDSRPASPDCRRAASHLHITSTFDRTTPTGIGAHNIYFPDTFPEPPMTDRELALVLPTETNIELLAEDVETARSYAKKSLSPATRDAYRSDLAVFRNWCHGTIRRKPGVDELRRDCSVRNIRGKRHSSSLSCVCYVRNNRAKRYVRPPEHLPQAAPPIGGC